MVELNDLFGKTSYQNEQYLVISKSDLNLNADANNTPESLFAAIILKASKQYLGILTDDNNNPITDPEGNVITYDNNKLFDSTRLTYYARYRPIRIVRDVFEYLEYIPYD